MHIKTNTYLALAVLSASLLSGCDKVSTFFGKDENKELVQRIETNTDDGKVGMLLPDFAQLVQNEGQAVVNIQATPAKRTATPDDDHQRYDLHHHHVGDQQGSLQHHERSDEYHASG